MDPSAFILVAGLALEPGAAAAPDEHFNDPSDDAPAIGRTVQLSEFGTVASAPPRRTRWGVYRDIDWLSIDNALCKADPEDEIDSLYRSLDNLLSRGKAPNSSEVQALFADLRKKQELEAERIATMLEGSLSMAIDAGQRAISSADVLLAYYEDTTTQNEPADSVD